MKKHLFHIVCFLLISLAGSAQTEVTSGLEKKELLIGEQTRLLLRAQFPKGKHIQFPEIKDTLAKGIEILKKGNIDTVPGADSSRMTLEQKITITSFDTGYAAIPPFSFLDDKGNKLFTEALLIGVHTVAVDTTRVFKDIRGVKSAPIPWWDYAWYLLLLIPLALSYTLYRYLKNKKKHPAPPAETPQPVIDPYLQALSELEALKQEGLWQSGFYKEYHSRISEILKLFISRAFALQVLELTSDETLQLFSTVEKRPEPIRQLRQILLLSDMVKFAKQVPIGSENDLSMMHAVAFVNFYSSQKQEENEVAAG